MEQKNNWILGIVFAVIGAIIAAIPWVLVYVYGNMILSLLAFIIALGALKGYQLSKAKIINKLPLIITIISVATVTLTTLIVIPLLMLYKEGYTADFNNLKILYQNKEFIGAIFKDFIISIIFTFIGIRSVVIRIKNSIDNNEEITSIFQDKDRDKAVEKIKEVFVQKNALTKENAIQKETVLNELSKEEKIYFNSLITQQIIKKHKNNYYFSEKMEKSFISRFLSLYLKIILIILVITIVFLIIVGILS